MTARIPAVEVTITYLEMHAPPQRPRRPAPLPAAQVIHAVTPPVHYYRYLYGAVGGPWHWVDRGKLSDDELGAIVRDPLVDIHVLHVDGAPAGYAELDRRDGRDIQLAYFGLVPEHIGRGLGGYFLDFAVQKAWTYAPARLWVHTCTLDHPAALPCYERAGFTVYAREQAMQALA